ncbi:MAG: Minichromosome maintenance protein MCM, partial [Desulfurococcaceae archaeon]
MPDSTTETFVDYVQQFKNFVENFRSREGTLRYYERIWELIRMGQRSLIINFDDLILFDPALAEKVLDNPAEVLEAFNQALQEIVMRENPE